MWSDLGDLRRLRVQIAMMASSMTDTPGLGRGSESNLCSIAVAPTPEWERSLVGGPHGADGSSDSAVDTDDAAEPVAWMAELPQTIVGKAVRRVRRYQRLEQFTDPSFGALFQTDA